MRLFKAYAVFCVFLSGCSHSQKKHVTCGLRVTVPIQVGNNKRDTYKIPLDFTVQLGDPLEQEDCK